MILKVKNENGEFKEVVLKGLKGERGERGEDGTVLQQKEIDNIKTSLDNIKNDKIKEVLVTDFPTWQDCHDYCKVNKKIMRIPKGTHILTTPLQVEGVTIVGDGALNTLIKIECSDGFILNHYEEQKPVEISGFSIVNYQGDYEKCGIRFAQNTTGKRSRGYKLDNLYFENLGCAIELTDCFRVGITRININNCFRAIYIKGQVVQLTGSDITSNCDILDSAISTRYIKSVGIELDGSTHSGVYQRPESIKFNNTSMVNHVNNLIVRDCLYGSFLQCDFDLSKKECIITLAYDGMLIIADSWIATKSTTQEPIVRIMNADNLYKKLVIRNNNISVLAGGHIDKGGIVLGYDTDTIGKKGVEIKGNTIQSFTTTKLKYGILAKNCVNPIISENAITGSTVADIFCQDLDGGVVSNNYIGTLNVVSNSSNKYVCTGNIGKLNITGTAIRIRDFFTGA